MSTKLPDYLISKLKKTLRGRIKLIIWRDISGLDDIFPSENAVIEYMLDLYQQNAITGELFSSLLSLDTSDFVVFSALETVANVEQLLHTLEENPIRKPILVELIGCPEGLPSTLGVLITRYALEDSGHVYEVTLIDEGAFPTSILGYFLIRASQKEPQPMFSVLRSGGYDRYNSSNYRKNPLLVIIVSILSLIPRTQPEIFEMNISDILSSDEFMPPDDGILMPLILWASSGKISCSRAKVQMDLVKPFSLDFCLSFAREIVDTHVRRIESGRFHELLVYWKDGAFIMNDDYPVYLAYRKLGIQEVPVVILGELPESSARLMDMTPKTWTPPYCGVDLIGI